MTERSSTIKEWSADDRPREKLLLKGRRALSDAELIAILIRSGTKSMSAVEVSRNLLQDAASNQLNELAQRSVHDLMKIKGIGQTKAITIVAALELSRRREYAPEGKPSIRSSVDAYKVMAPLLEDLTHEEFYVAFLNRANRVIESKQLSSGGISGTVADHRIIFRWALERNASSIVLAHNHPSGNLQPSQADLALTKKIKDAGLILDIQLLDHLIIGHSKYLSFADEGLM